MSREIGAQLRQAREEAGLSLEDIREQTQIDSVTLKSLENGDFHKISSPFYVRSHIRAYAKLVGLEPTNLLKKYRPIPDGDDCRKNGNQTNDSIGQQTSVFRPVNQETGNQSSAEGLQKTSVFHGIQKSKMGHSSGSGSINPGNQESQKPVSGSGNSSIEEESLPSRSQSQGKKWSAARLTETLKMPALKLKNDEQEVDDHLEESGEQPSLSGQEESPLDGGLPSRSQKKSSSRLTETLKMPALKLKNDEQEADDQLKESGEQPSLSGQEESPLDGSLPSRSQKKSSSRLTETLKMPALKRENDEPEEENQPKEFSEQPTLSGQEEGPLDGSLPSRSRKMDHQQTEVLNVEGENQKEKRRLSRSKQKKTGTSNGKWKIWTAVASIILVVPVSVWMFNSGAEGSTKSSADSKKEQPKQTEMAQDDKGSTKLAKVEPVRSDGKQIGEYKVSQPGMVAIHIKSNGESWVQIRETKKANDRYLKDVTLKKAGDTVEFQESDIKSDLWIQIGSPENVEITINNQPIQPKSLIQLKK
ncbi:helix-turn-helix domain-containing protein [Melghirimyces algeriensis]|uniref:Cytoskeleton protein RodZ-like C-terminal domain-containing protein n=1 Tax=Melghirimyces algeriensis TaxID=910412 RepID=A0A521E187_9BACL|nr:helix-turn-helix domain-containing protein [Melghirimyces algeriensis]SMO77733.1 protein of unknown function [Melghirimyces algeriensis]